MALQDVITIPSEERNRETGIPAVGAVPWGTHLCSFYDTEQDLLEVLVPYFKVGLENNEFCIWVTSELLGEKEAKKAMTKAVPDFAQYLERGQIEIVPYNEWYLKDGAFNLRRVLNSWIDKLDRATANGYDGIRVTGNMAWLEKRNWRNFTDYEEEVNNVIDKYRMLALCTYSLGKCGANEIIDVMGNHQFGLIRRAGEWMLIKPRERQEMASPVTSRGPLTPLQTRFAKSGLEGFSEREVMELLLSLCQGGMPEQVSEECLKAFKNIRELLAASPHELQQAGCPAQFGFYLKLLHDIPAEVLREKIIERPVFQSSQEVFDYLYYSMRDLKKEVFKVIYLNNQDRIIDVVNLFEGVAGRLYVYPRKVIEDALEHSAAALIFVHNHPSGDHTPSKIDKRLTRDLVFVGNILQIRVSDHIIIGDNRYFSFADAGLIQQYEDDFLKIEIKRI